MCGRQASPARPISFVLLANNRRLFDNRVSLQPPMPTEKPQSLDYRNGAEGEWEDSPSRGLVFETDYPLLSTGVLSTTRHDSWHAMQENESGKLLLS